MWRQTGDILSNVIQMIAKISFFWLLGKRKRQSERTTAWPWVNFLRCGCWLLISNVDTKEKETGCNRKVWPGQSFHRLAQKSGWRLLHSCAPCSDFVYVLLHLHCTAHEEQECLGLDFVFASLYFFSFRAFLSCAQAFQAKQVMSLKSVQLCTGVKHVGRVDDVYNCSHTNGKVWKSTTSRTNSVDS